jgi:hypothetical protein
LSHDDGSGLSHGDLLKIIGGGFLFTMGAIGAMWRWVAATFQRDHVHRDEFENLLAMLRVIDNRLVAVETRQADIRATVTEIRAVDIAELKGWLARLDTKVEDVRHTVISLHPREGG